MAAVAPAPALSNGSIIKPNVVAPGMAPSPTASSDSSTISTSSDAYGPGSTIPPATPARSLILCFDGTGDQFDADNSNIVQLFSMLKKGDTTQQLVYYQAGIGTYTIPQIATPLYSKLSKTWDLMVASSLDHHVMSGYEFLMESCELPVFKEGRGGS